MVATIIYIKTQHMHGFIARLIGAMSMVPNLELADLKT